MYTQDTQAKEHVIQFNILQKSAHIVHKEVGQIHYLCVTRPLSDEMLLPGQDNAEVQWAQ